MRPASQLYGQIRVGRVSSVDADRHTAQVEFSEQDTFVSWDLQVLRGFAADYCLPAQNTPVLCLLVDGRLGVGYVLGAIYTESDAAPLSDAGQRSVAGNDLRLGAPDASDKVALAPATKDEIQKALDYADGIASAIKAGAVVAQDGGASLKSSIVAALPVKPTLNAPAAEKVSAK
jgi:hypothetical protein